ncbi:hypothetical protein BDY21DRAFT_216226 [Lineolata rhizophorae]|uniref:Secreted protein n=1 Tax=Lineolata rhizophorae TaxID=578093 RepID=A0A6A6P2P9_9PEZI|nr:hypothetical protein BDY21DRAFT_216226 [Lineolata rhizophorae]
MIQLVGCWISLRVSAAASTRAVEPAWTRAAEKKPRLLARLGRNIDTSMIDWIEQTFRHMQFFFFNSLFFRSLRALRMPLFSPAIFTDT